MAALTKIVSGGQTGVDRGALDAALAAGFPCGGWCPKDRNAEDGPIPDKYPMTLLAGGAYRQRTVKNVLDSDAPQFCSIGRSAVEPFIRMMSVGVNASRTLRWMRRRYRCRRQSAAIVRFIKEHDIQVLNVAGPRASRWAEGHRFAMEVVQGVIGNLQGRT